MFDYPCLLENTPVCVYSEVVTELWGRCEVDHSMVGDDVGMTCDYDITSLWSRVSKIFTCMFWAIRSVRVRGELMRCFGTLNERNDFVLTFLKSQALLLGRVPGVLADLTRLSSGS